MGPYQENKVDMTLNIVTFGGRVRMGIVTKKFDILTKLFGHSFEDSLLIVTPIVGVCNCSMFCCPFYYCNHLGGEERELVALLCFSSWCLLIVVWLFLTMPCVRLQFVIVVFPDHTHYFF